MHVSGYEIITSLHNKDTIKGQNSRNEKMRFAVYLLVNTYPVSLLVSKYNCCFASDYILWIPTLNIWWCSVVPPLSINTLLQDRQQ